MYDLIVTEIPQVLKEADLGLVGGDGLQILYPSFRLFVAPFWVCTSYWRK